MLGNLQLQPQLAVPAQQSFGFLGSGDKEGDFLSSLLPAGLNLDDDNFDFGAGSPSAGPDSHSSTMRNAFDALLRFDGSDKAGDQ